CASPSDAWGRNYGPRFTISLKRSTQNLQLSTTTPADYPIFGSKADIASVIRSPRPRARLACLEYWGRASTTAPLVALQKATATIAIIGFSEISPKARSISELLCTGYSGSRTCRATDKRFVR
ncbi:MAG: hypothetical protein WCD13_07220, partial [Pseudolabrys sp.]